MSPKLILVTGNIGSGKTTFCENYCKEHPGAIPLYEDLEDWDAYIRPYYEIINSNKTSFSLEE